MTKRSIFFQLVLLLTLNLSGTLVSAQTVKITETTTQMTTVFKEIKKQTGYGFVYSTSDLKNSKPIHISAGEKNLDAILNEIFKDQPLTYTINDKLITVRLKSQSKEVASVPVNDQQSIINVNGRVLDSHGQLVKGATVQVKGRTTGTVTDVDGRFTLENISSGSILRVSFVGYEPTDLIAREQVGTITLVASDFNIEEVSVMNTGYYQAPKERATGSFTYVDQKTIERGASTNILQRLEGLASGLQFTKAGATSTSDIRVRGLSTLQGNKRPLIVIDNFPYEGNLYSKNSGDASNEVDLSFINPNDVESITILKDAAAASIWGARAGNGVIVITTKSGRFDQKSRVNFSYRTTIDQKPNLMYDRGRISSDAMLEIEKIRFDRNNYARGTNVTIIPEYAEWLHKFNDGAITATELADMENVFRNTEVRDDIHKYLLQTGLQQQYNLDLSGGSSKYAYYLSAGYNHGRSNWIGDNSNRLNLSTQHRMRPVKNLEILARVDYSENKTKNNAITTSDLTNGMGIGLSPYMRLVDEQGNHLPIVKDYRSSYKTEEEELGLLDWSYVPLNEQRLKNKKTNAREIRFNADISYSFLDMFRANITYSHTQGQNDSEDYYDKDTYYVRNLVNRFTNNDMFQQIPYGDIRILGTPYESRQNNVRGTLHFNNTFSNDHHISAIAGAEISEGIRSATGGHYYYNYNKETGQGETALNYNTNYPVRPSGNVTIPSQFPINNAKFTDRYLSYFGNASYTYQDKYVASASLRWDASNLFGVKTNQKGTPLWSLGGVWHMHNEDFYNVDWLPELSLRATYGSAGNVYKDISHFATIRYNTQRPVETPQGTIMSAGNPSLRWEKVSTTNLALDFSALSHRIRGSFDYYIKNATDLIGEDYLAPSTGIITGGTAANSKLINYASMRTHGLDLTINTKNLVGSFQWNSTVLFSISKNKITDVYTNPNARIESYYSTPPAPISGVSRDLMYSIPWTGLDPETGYPIYYMPNGDRVTNFPTYQKELKVEMLNKSGVSVDPYFGSVRNDFTWKNIDLSFLITWKSGSVFRRSSIYSGAEFNGTYHQDYYKRWEKPGDEKFTHVPAYAETFDASASTTYNFSEILITRGDLIRLNDITLGYTLNKRFFPRLPFQSIRLTAQANNLGLIWKSNKHDIDPDFANSAFVTPKSFSFGLHVNM
ncbi:SusC/RagA family TonB-linked outer membrane protein [Sphingobacterium sp. UT-1RO-CII-1]|uniref:SusC/RagA family TonB-linked outer membrane protein n=1 Tax=Sphingobacterium sp. UT-1RO-CII-1 TaxID=2995225 RepID=UPI00227A0850|nr:SusC/RagA family TonB-linked outer membrane protein [Sphingobacterium sp. UT-1RO-CII-1]MCY4780741.1 SusC/RagA family TonB-linked outer membrane protein [Sphingobacterium sp. UT-1RO-CII-1]